MAKYNVTYGCGHSGTVSLYGKNVDRERKLKWMETVDCLDCCRIKRESAHAEATKLAAEQATAQGLPKLVGSKKQRAWAETIRKDALIAPWNIIRTDVDAKSHPQYNIVAEAQKRLETETSAKWWIDNRNSINTYMRDCFYAANKVVQN
jgi:hypothetical protein